jgi:hypothetical protein
MRTTSHPFDLPHGRVARQAGARIAGVAMLLLVVLFSGLGEARNPDLSDWTQNLSEGAASSEPGEDDFAPEVVVVGTTVHVMWLTQNGDYTGHKLYYRRSLDNGNTWQEEQLLLEHGDMVTSKTYKRMVVIDGTVHIAFGYYAGSWYGVLGYLRSLDNGASFEPLRNLYTAGNAYHVLDVRLATSHGKLTIGFRVQANWKVDNAYHVLNSDDHGETFVTRTVYSTDSGNGWRVVDLQRTESGIYVAYTDSDYYYGLIYSRLYLAVSTDGGQAFTSTMMSIPSLNGHHKTYSLQDEHYVPKIAMTGNHVYVIWNGLDGADQHGVFVRRSTDAGATFEDARNLTEGLLDDGQSLQQGHETIAAQGDHVYAVYVTSTGDVQLRRSGDGGANFEPPQELSRRQLPFLEDNAWPVVQTDPSVADGSSVHLFWCVPTQVSSTDGGGSFTRPARVSPYFSYGGTLTSRATAPQMAVGPDGKLHILHRSRYYSNDFGGYGDFDIFYRRLDRAPFASGGNNALHLFSDRDAAHFDNMQVRASEHINFTTSMTGEIWVRPYPDGETTGSTSAIKPVFLKSEQDFHNAYALQTRDWYGARQAQAEIHTTDGTFHVNPDDATGLVPDNEWSHLAFTYDAGGGNDNLKLYLNGELIASTTASGELATGDGLLLIGRYGSWDVTEMRLWDKALAAQELQAGMFTALRQGTPGLKAYYRFRNTSRDFSGNRNDGILMYRETYVTQDFISELNDIQALLPILNLLFDE